SACADGGWREDQRSTRNIGVKQLFSQVRIRAIDVPTGGAPRQRKPDSKQMPEPVRMKSSMPDTAPPPTDSSAADPAARKWRWFEVLLIFLIFFIHGGWAAP